MSDGRISQGDIVEASAYQEARDLNAVIQELVSSFKELKSTATTLDVKIDGASGIKDLTVVIKEISSASKKAQESKKSITDLSLAVAEYNKNLSATAQTNAKLSVATSEEIKNYYAAKVALQEKSKELLAEAKAQNTTVQARNAAVQAELQSRKEVKAASDQAKIDRQLEIAGAKEAKAIQDELKRAQQESINVKKAEAKAHKEAVQAQRDNEITTRMFTKAIDDLNRKKEKEEALLVKNSNAYEILKKEYNEAAYATKTLAAEYVILERSGKATVDQLNKMKLALDAQQKSTLAQSSALLQMEQAVGQNQRAVGNYANATGEITQILRELPNFAISAQTGILSLSNNLPMLQASLSRLAQTIDVNTGKAIGWVGVLKTIGASIFSVQGLIVLGTTLLVAYGDKIPSIISGTVAMDKANESYKKALAGAVDGIAKQVGQLTILKAAIDDSAVSQEKKNQILRDTQKMMPGYLDSINSENLQLSITNKLIEDQISLLIRQARHKAAIDSVTDAEKELILSQQKLNDKIGFWEKAFAGAKGYFGILSGLDMKQQVIAGRIIDIGHAEDQLAISVKRATNAFYDRNQAIEKEIVALEKEKSEITQVSSRESEWFRNSNGEMQKRTFTVLTLTEAEKAHKLAIDNKIDSLQEEIKKNNELAEAQDALETKNKRLLSNEDLNVVKAENNARRFTKGTKERLDADFAAVDARTAKLIQANKDQYGTNQAALKQNEEFLTKESEIYTKAAQEKDALQESFNKKNKPKKERAAKEPLDLTSEILADRQKVFEATQNIAKSELEFQNSHLENIFNIESNNLAKRLDAYEQYVANLQGIQAIENRNDIEEKESKLSQIEVIEKRIGFVVTEENRKQLEAMKGLTTEEKKLLVEKISLREQLVEAEKTNSQDLQKINEEAQKKEREIIESNTKYLISQLNTRFAAIRDSVSSETSLRLSNLNKQRELGELTEREYWQARQRIGPQESKILFDKQLDFLKAEYSRIISDPMIPDAIRHAIEKLKGDLEKMRPEPRKTESKSILEYLGLNSRVDIEAQDAARGVERARVSLDDALAKYQVTESYWADELERSKKEAADKFGAGTDEYNAAVIAATDRQAAGLTSAQQAVDMFTRDYESAVANAEENAARVTERLKESIANSLKGLYDTLFRAIDEGRENYYKERFDFFDEEKNKIQENADAEKAAIQSSLLSQEEKERQLAAIDGRRIAEEKKNDAQVRALKREQAIREKKDAIFKIEMEGGIAAAKALAGAAENPILAIAAAALIAAQTIANVALINSRPIPEYWKGTENHPGGPAIVGERGHELVQLRNGESFLTPNKPTLIDLQAGAKVISNDKLSEAATRAAMMEMSNVQGGATPDAYASAMALNFEHGLNNLGNRFENGIKQIPITQLYWDDGQLKRRIVKGNMSVKILNGHKGWS